MNAFIDSSIIVNRDWIHLLIYFQWITRSVQNKKKVSLPCFSQPLSISNLHPPQLIGTYDANETTNSHIANAQLTIKVVALLYVFPNPI